MSEKQKRPVLLWLILIWFSLGALLGIYDIYLLLVDPNITFVDMYEPSLLTDYYLQTSVPKILGLVAAILLFVRHSIAKWLFLALFLLSIAIRVYMVFSEPHAEPLESQYLLTMLFAPVLFAVITWYSFYLQKKDYYISLAPK